MNKTIEQYRQESELLVVKGHITRFELLEDTEHLLEKIKKIEKSDESLFTWVRGLYINTFAPIHFDDVKELITNHIREEIRKDIQLNNPELWTTYDRNKFQQSNAQNNLMVIDIISNLVDFPEELVNEFQKARFAFTEEEGNENFSHVNYKSFFDNEKKYMVVKMIESLSLKVLRHLVSQ